MTKMYPGNIVFSSGLCWITGTICRFSFLYAMVDELKGNKELLPQVSWRQPHEIPPCTYPASHSPQRTSTSHGPTALHTPVWNLLSAILGNVTESS